MHVVCMEEGIHSARFQPANSAGRFEAFDDADIISTLTPGKNKRKNRSYASNFAEASGSISLLVLRIHYSPSVCQASAHRVRHLKIMPAPCGIPDINLHVNGPPAPAVLLHFGC